MYEIKTLLRLIIIPINMLKKQVLNSDTKERQQKIVAIGLSAIGIQYPVWYSPKQIDIQCVLRMLDDFCRYLKSNQFFSATKELSILEKYITEAFLPQQWENQSIKRTTTSIIEEFKIIVDEIKKSRDQNSKLELLIKRNDKELFQKNRNIEQNKNALIKLLANNELQQALKLAQNVKEFHPISDLIQKIRQYNFITDRHKALTIGLNKDNISWTVEDINFNQIRASLKLFIDQQYRKSQDLYGKMIAIIQILRTTRQIPYQMERQNFQFNPQFLKNLIHQKYQQYQLMKWVQSIQQNFIKYQILQENYKKHKRSTKLQLLKENIVNIISFYKQNKKNLIIFNQNLKEQSSKITLSTAKSSLANIDLDTNQQLIDQIKYRERSFKDYLQDNKVLKQKLQKFKQTQQQLQATIKKMKQKVANLVTQNYDFNVQNKELLKKLQTRRLNQQAYQKFLLQKDKFQQQLCRKKSILKLKDFIQRYKAFKEYQQSQRFGQFNQVSLNRTENIHSYEQSFNLANSKIIKEQFGQLQKVLKKQIPYLSFQNFQRVFIHESKQNRQKKQVKNQLLRNIYGKNHLLFIIKLVQKSKIIIVYIQKQILKENQLKNIVRPEISMIKKSIDQRSNKSEEKYIQNYLSMLSGDQEQFSNKLSIQRSISISQSLNESEHIKQKDNSFIITLWNKNKFIPQKPVRLLKFNDKRQLLFGEKDLIINIDSGQISSYIGFPDNQVFAYDGPQNIKLTAWAHSKFKFQQMQIFYYKQTNQKQKNLRKS